MSVVLGHVDGRGEHERGEGDARNPGVEAEGEEQAKDEEHYAA